MQTLAQLSQNVLNNRNEPNISLNSIRIDKLQIYPGQLIILGARPCMGKTTFLMFLLQTLFEQSTEGLLLVSNEQSELKSYKRLACQVSSISQFSIDTTIEEVILTHQRILGSDRIFITHLRSKWEEQREQIIKSIRQNSIRFLFLDKFQGLHSNLQYNNRDQELESILTDLKQIAIDFNLVVVATSSLSRSVDHRIGKRPQLSDLRGSGAIEDISDVVMMLMRHEYYGITEDEDGNSLMGLANLMVVKNNNGPLFEMRFHFMNEIPQFKSFVDFKMFNFTKEFESKYITSPFDNPI